MKKLYVDDMRTPPEGWDLARTVEEARMMLEEGAYQEVSLDFVIGMQESHNFSPVARFIAAMPAEKRPKKVYIHTSSPQGAQILRSILEDFIDDIVRV